MNDRKALAGWCLFDVANSAYTTIVITVAFNVIFTKLIVGPDAAGEYSHGNALWAWTLAASWLVVAFAGPVLGAVSDSRGWRKPLLAASVALCCVGSVALYFVSPGAVGLAVFLILVSNMGYSLSENFISAFLPSVAKSEDMGRVSGLAWGLGYFGGLGSILLVQAVTGLHYGMDNFSALRWVGPLTAGFFLLGALPALFWLKEPPRVPNPPGSLSRIGHTIERLKSLPDLGLLLFSAFFFQGGLAIVISFAAIYGEQEVGLTGGWQAALFISLQLTAAGGAFFFGWLQSRWSGLKTLNVTLYIWLTVIVLIYQIKPLSEFLGIADLRVAFLVVGNLAGLCLGATQSVARALVGQMAPMERSGEVFGLWGFSGKLAMVFSLFVFGGLQKWVGLRHSLLFCAVLFVISLWLHRSIEEKRPARV
jgi:UMF1 family MFS transporter